MNSNYIQYVQCKNCIATCPGELMNPVRDNKLLGVMHVTHLRSAKQEGNQLVYIDEPMCTNRCSICGCTKPEYEK